MVAQAMQQLTTAKLQMQAATDAQMEKLLSAANVASKADVEALGTRLAAMESALARIEGHLRGAASAPSAKPGPRRTRKPPG
jgi:polyhydroxyalkanoate synthesis regulator phasin